MHHCRYTFSLTIILIILCLFAVSAAEGAEPFIVPQDIAEEVAEEEAAEEALEAEEIAEEEEEDEVLWYGRITLARSASIALRGIMTTGNSYPATGTALKGEIVSVLAEHQQWAYVRARDGEGYILLKFLKPAQPGEEEEPVPTPEPVPEATKGPYLPVSDEPFEPTAYLDTRSAFPQEAGEAQKVLLSFIGDVTLGCNEDVHKSNRSIDAYVSWYGYDYPFRKVAYILAQDDLTIANLEGTFHSDSTGLTPQTKKAYNFRATPDFAQILNLGSVEAVAVGNNHSGDYGEPGFLETAEVLEKYGIEWFGNADYGARGYVFEHDGVRIGFIGCYVSYWVINNGEHLPQINATIDEVKAQDVDMLIAYMHGGVEYDIKHDRNQERFAQFFINKGADIVIGSHPHRLQGCSLIDGVPVFYSLGNFIFGGNTQFYNKKRDSYISYTAILQCALSFDEDHRYLGCRFNIVPCRLGENSMINQYQPFPVTGEDADACLAELQLDTNKFWRLENVQEGIGAMQGFIPAKKK